MNTGTPNPRRSRAELDRLLDGVDDGTPLSGFLAELRALKSTEPTQPDRALTEFVSAPARAGDAIPNARKKTAMLTAFSAALGTTVGKVVLTGTAAAALVTGAALTDVIDVPGVGPDRTEVISTFDDSGDDATGSSTTATTAPTSSSSTSTTSTTTTSTTIAPARIDVSGLDLPDSDDTTITASDAGTVTVRVADGQLILVSIDAAAGWTANDEGDEPGEIDVSFRRGDDRVDVDIELEDGRIRVRVRDRRTGDEVFTNLDGTPFPRNDDDSDDDSDDSDDDFSDDNSGSGSDDDDSGDNSGSGSDDDDSDDNSGSGSDDDDSDDSDDDDSDDSDDDDSDDSDDSGSDDDD